MKENVGFVYKLLGSLKSVEISTLPLWFLRNAEFVSDWLATRVSWRPAHSVEFATYVFVCQLFTLLTQKWARELLSDLQRFVHQIPNRK